jgi:hypothetical protein
MNFTKLPRGENQDFNILLMELSNPSCKMNAVKHPYEQDSFGQIVWNPFPHATILLGYEWVERKV